MQFYYSSVSNVFIFVLSNLLCALFTDKVQNVVTFYRAIMAHFKLLIWWWKTKIGKSVCKSVASFSAAEKNVKICSMVHCVLSCRPLCLFRLLAVQSGSKIFVPAISFYGLARVHAGSPWSYPKAPFTPKR